MGTAESSSGADRDRTGDSGVAPILALPPEVGHAATFVPRIWPNGEQAIASGAKLSTRRSHVGGPPGVLVDMHNSRTAGLAPFEQVLERHGGDVWRFTASQVGVGRADDVFQETMLAALAAYPSLRDPGAVRAWLFAIAARKAIDAFRAGARAAVPVADPEALAPVAPPEPEPADQELWAGVRALPAKQRQAVGLRFLLDLDYAAIGAAMETSTEAARRNVFEGLRTLRAGIGDRP
jgi:RNA polymerase sigma factor (sigma-70 family)